MIVIATAARHVHLTGSMAAPSYNFQHDAHVKSTGSFFHPSVML